KTCSSVAIWVAVALIVGLSSSIAWASQPTPAIAASLDPKVRTVEAGPQELVLTIITAFDCEELNLDISIEKLTLNGLANRTISVRANEKSETLLYVDIPRGDTSMVRVNITGCREGTGAILSFVTTGDSVEYHHGPPMPDRPARGRGTARPFDQPTELQLDSNLYEYMLDLRIKMMRDFVKSLPIELIPTEQENIFKVWMTRDQFRKLKNEGVKGRMIEGQMVDTLPPPVDRIRPDSSTRKQKPRGALGSPTDPASSGDFSLAGIDGLSGGLLQAEQLVTFYLHIDNSTNYDVDGVTNGFRFYSPDGATWADTEGDTLGTLDWGAEFDLLFISFLTVCRARVLIL
ncbi:MAG: hypothetical protein OEV80_17025, partial [candidate division Zixibacteria bacterium]|nr:hypothetical protein [candidate division Zixibacteria bacterium]